MELAGHVALCTKVTPDGEIGDYIFARVLNSGRRAESVTRVIRGDEDVLESLADSPMH